MTATAAATAHRTSADTVDMARDVASTLSDRGGIGAVESEADDWSGE